MSSDLPTLQFLALYILSLHILQTNSRTSTHWKLSGDRVVEATNVVSSDTSLTADTDDSSELADTDQNTDKEEHDPILDILTSRMIIEDGWHPHPIMEGSCSDCSSFPSGNTADGYPMKLPTKPMAASRVSPKKGDPDQNSSRSRKTTKTPTRTNVKSTSSANKDILDCGPVVNMTKYDHLRGIASRSEHPHVPEPEVALIFKKKSTSGRNTELDMTDLEQRLRKTLKERPNSPQVYNQIGNFWRIRGNTQISIDCFRKALSIAPSNADVLLNLARVLFNLQFLDDAIFLTRRSLEAQTPDQNAWLQHYTLGEILKAYGHFQEATHHFRHTLELKRGFQPAQAHLREMEASPDGTITYYTLFIILFLVMGVLCGFLTTVETTLEEYGDAMKSQRHFNRAMAMRKMTVNINPKSVVRAKKTHC